MNAITILPKAAELLGEALDWRLIGLLFERPRGGWWRDTAALSAASVDPVLKEAGELAREVDERKYIGLLGPGGPVSPRESGYRKTADPARSLSEIRAFFAAFAFDPEREDPVDHVAVMCAFIGWMRMKEAYAVASGDAEAMEVTRAAADKFAREHLAPCAEGLCARLEEFEAGHLVVGARALLDRVGPRPKGMEGDWVPQGVGLDGGEMTCGLDESSGEEPVGEVGLPPEFTAGLRRDLVSG